MLLVQLYNEKLWTNEALTGTDTQVPEDLIVYNKVMLNDGSGVFTFAQAGALTRIGSIAMLDSRDALTRLKGAAVDVDGDGDLDLVLGGRWKGEDDVEYMNPLLINEGEWPRSFECVPASLRACVHAHNTYRTPPFPSLTNFTRTLHVRTTRRCV